MSFKQHNPPHPGALIKRTYIESYEEITTSLVADKLGVARRTFNRLINESSNVTPEMSLRLSKVLGGTPESWLTLQENYDLWKARKKIDTTSLKRIDFNKNK